MLYNAAVQQGFSSGQLLLTGQNAGTKAAYDAAYNTTAARIAAGRAKAQVEANISAIQQDKILSNSVIQQQQAAAEAEARVSAAAAGVSGGSVDQVIYDTQKNATLRKADANAIAEKEIASQRTQVGSAQLTIETSEFQEQNLFGTLLEGFSSISLDDIRGIGEFFSSGTAE